MLCYSERVWCVSVLLTHQIHHSKHNTLNFQFRVENPQLDRIILNAIAGAKVCANQRRVFPAA